MLTRPLKALLIAPFVLTVVVIAFAVRPTPILGVDGQSLGRSVEGFLVASDPCEELKSGGRWRCAKTDTGGSGAVSYTVEVDWWGCWDGRREGPSASEGGTPPRLSGCVTLLSHLGS